ncbi:hypothetical protein [Streptomyces sp. NPDC057877]|uniref:hypothetical protein n=1 Tax=Streptomyces sp. NPDC057877 TaxID=3346269 RepID=UPI0036A820C9
MDPTTYVAPNGATQLVASPQVAERMRAAGWRPYEELAALADNDDPTAREHLKRAEIYAEQRRVEQEAREARFAPARPAAAAEAEPAKPAAATRRRARD